MISKIIQKEKERQEEILNGCSREEYFTEFNCDLSCKFWSQERREYYICDKCKAKMMTHKQSLINLKEYMEEEVMGISGQTYYVKEKLLQLKEDIEELTKMIETYK